MIIESGLNEGETVVTEGTDRLQPGVTKVTIKGQGKKAKKDAGQPANEKSGPADPKAAQTDATEDATSETTGYRGADSGQESPAQATGNQPSKHAGSDPTKKKPNETKTPQ
jgi:hypothetical protein